MTKIELQKNIGKILLKENEIYKWMFKLLEVKTDALIITQGMDIHPEPRAYLMEMSGGRFTDVYESTPISNGKIRTPTKKELDLYRKYTRELRIFGTNKSHYGTK